MSSTMTQEEVSQKIKEESEKELSKIDKVFEKLNSEEYKDRAYAPDSKVEISGKLFSTMVNMIANQRVILNGMKEAYAMLQTSVDACILDAEKMTYQLMEQHIENVDKGATISSEEMDKLDAQHKIKEVDKDGK